MNTNHFDTLWGKSSVPQHKSKRIKNEQCYFLKIIYLWIHSLNTTQKNFVAIFLIACLPFFKFWFLSYRFTLCRFSKSRIRFYFFGKPGEHVLANRSSSKLLNHSLNMFLTETNTTGYCAPHIRVLQEGLPLV